MLLHYTGNVLYLIYSARAYLSGGLFFTAQFQHARVKPDKTNKLKFSIYSGSHESEKKILVGLQPWPVCALCQLAGRIVHDM